MGHNPRYSGSKADCTHIAPLVCSSYRKFHFLCLICKQLLRLGRRNRATDTRISASYRTDDLRSLQQFSEYQGQ